MPHTLLSSLSMAVLMLVILLEMLVAIGKIAINSRFMARTLEESKVG